jgi:hypothetical protein
MITKHKRLVTMIFLVVSIVILQEHYKTIVIVNAIMSDYILN